MDNGSDVVQPTNHIRKRKRKGGRRAGGGDGSAQRRKQQRMRSWNRRKANNTWDHQKEELMRGKKETKAQRARQTNDKRKFKTASDCMTIHYEGQKSLTWMNEARHSFFNNVQAKPLQVQIQSTPPPSPPPTPVYTEDSTPFGGFDE